MNDILAGLRVVEGSAFVAAPLAGMTLAQLGADVIRSEISWGTAGLNGAEAPYMCIGQIYMKTMAGLNSAFSNHMDDMVNDIPKN